MRIRRAWRSRRIPRVIGCPEVPPAGWNPAEPPPCFGHGRANPHCRGVLWVAGPGGRGSDPLRPEAGRPCAASAACPGDTERVSCKLSPLLGCPLAKALRIAKLSTSTSAAYRRGFEAVLSSLGAGPSSRAWPADPASNGWQRSARVPWLAAGISPETVGFGLARSNPCLEASISLNLPPGTRPSRV